MPETDEAIVLKRAKELWEEEGYTPDFDFTSPDPLSTRILLSEEGRQRYIKRARAELREESRSNA